MKKLLAILAILAISLASGCATIVCGGSSNVDMKVSSQEKFQKEYQCLVMNEDKEIARFDQSMETVSLPKTYNDTAVVICHYKNENGETKEVARTIKSKINGGCYATALIVDAILLCPIGLIDIATNPWMEWPTSVNVDKENIDYRAFVPKDFNFEKQMLANEKEASRDTAN